MFLGFPLDYQLLDFVKAAVAPFGHLISWLEGPNKSRVLTRSLVLTPERVPRSLIVSQGSLLGGTMRSWSVPVFILDGHFPDAFPPNEDPVPMDGLPHPLNGQVQDGNPNALQGWQHDLHGARHHVHADFGLNAEQMGEVQQDLEMQENVDDWDAEVEQDIIADEWESWLVLNQNEHILQNPDNAPPQPQDSISFDQSGTTANYLRAH